MRILIEPSGYKLGNMGDAAMLQVTVLRLLELWPDAQLQVITQAPQSLAGLFPQVTMLDPQVSPLDPQLSPLGPQVSPLIATGRSVWFRLRHWLRLAEQNNQKGFESFVNKLRFRAEYATELKQFTSAVKNCDLFVVSGAGGLTDCFREHAISVLDVMEFARKEGKVVAMFSQGLGPIEDPDLRRRAAEVLPEVPLLCLRESQSGLPFAESLGVDRALIRTTGDDAIEPAFDNRSERISDAIGVNLRVASYSEVQASQVQTVKRALQAAAEQLGCALLPVPISLPPNTSDPDSIRELLDGCGGAEDGGAGLDAPLKIIRQIGRCRVVATGSYHAGVFALSQGIPVIGLANSAYYRDKFHGLANQFSVGCETVFLHDPNLEEVLNRQLRAAWKSADEVRPRLIEDARWQIQQSRDAYRELKALV